MLNKWIPYGTAVITGAGFDWQTLCRGAATRRARWQAQGARFWVGKAIIEGGENKFMAGWIPTPNMWIPYG